MGTREWARCLIHFPASFRVKTPSTELYLNDPSTNTITFHVNKNQVYPASFPGAWTTESTMSQVSIKVMNETMKIRLNEHLMALPVVVVIHEESGSTRNTLQHPSTPQWLVSVLVLFRIHKGRRSKTARVIWPDLILGWNSNLRPCFLRHLAVGTLNYWATISSRKYLCFR